MCGNATELRDTSNTPGKSFLFFLTVTGLGIGLPGEEVEELGKHCIFVVSGALLMVRENLRKISSHPRSY